MEKAVESISSKCYEFVLHRFPDARSKKKTGVQSADVPSIAVGKQLTNSLLEVKDCVDVMWTYYRLNGIRVSSVYGR